MKFTCTQENFLEGVRHVAHLAGKNTTLPILNHILLKAEKGTLQLLTTNLEIGITSTVRAKIEQEGSITLPAKALLEYIQLLPKETIQCETEEQNLIIQGGKQKTKIRGASPEDFPLLPAVSIEQEIHIPEQDMRRALSRVVFSVAQDETRVDISGIFIKVEKKQETKKTYCVLVATDSYRLAEHHIPLEETTAQDIHTIIPTRTIQELLRLLREGGETPTMLTMGFGGHQVLFSFNNITLLSRVIEGKYPDYQAIIPQHTKMTFHTDRLELIRAVRSASIFSRPGIYDVRFAFDAAAKELTLASGNNQLGEHEAHVIGDLEGNDTNSIFNHRYVLDGLSAMESDRVSIALVDASSPAVFRPEGDTSYQYLVMPIKQ